ncbi:MAG: chemotaxis protein CheX [Kiritimatiellae bacterium]|nr:chemotaxis protein CheX [Kiritimatiellia bacterium]
MAAKFFGQYLLEKGAITRAMLLDAIEYQRQINTPLCMLAVEKGYLSRDQLRALDEAHKTSDKKFMELAVKENMLSFEQLEELGNARSERWMFLGEALVQRGHLTLVRLNELLEEYTRDLQPAATETDDALAGVPEQEVVSALLQVTVDLFLHYTKQIVQIVSVDKARAEPDDIAYVFAQRVTGDKKFHYALALPEELILSIASYMLGEQVAEVDDMALDTVSEFVNVVIGNGCTKLSMENFKVHAEPPRVMTKQMMQDLLPSHIVAVNMRTTKGVFRILFFFEQENNSHR